MYGFQVKGSEQRNLGIMAIRQLVNEEPDPYMKKLYEVRLGLVDVAATFANTAARYLRVSESLVESDNNNCRTL